MAVKYIAAVPAYNYVGWYGCAALGAGVLYIRVAYGVVTYATLMQ